MTLGREIFNEFKHNVILFIFSIIITLESLECHIKLLTLTFTSRHNVHILYMASIQFGW